MEYNPKYFEEKLIVLEKRILVVFKNNYIRNLERARDKQIVKKEQLFNYFCEFRTRFFPEKPIVKIIASFDYYYLRGLPIDLLMCDIERDSYRQKENEEDALPKEYLDPYNVLFLCAKYAVYYQFIKGFQKNFPWLQIRQKETDTE